MRISAGEMSNTHAQRFLVAQIDALVAAAPRKMFTLKAAMDIEQPQYIRNFASIQEALVESYTKGHGETLAALKPVTETPPVRSTDEIGLLVYKHVTDFLSATPGYSFTLKSSTEVRYTELKARMLKMFSEVFAQGAVDAKCQATVMPG